MNYILFNPLSGHGKSAECAAKISADCKDASILVDMTSVDYSELFSNEVSRAIVNP